MACRPDPAPDAGVAARTPVRAVPVERKTLVITTSAPGRTDALEQQKIRAPFKGKLVALHVADGDRVREGQVIAEIVSRESEAALVGAQALLAAAQTAQARLDAQRAMEIARRGLVRASLRAPEASVVVAHTADEGSFVAEGQDICSLAASDSFIFRADLVQMDLARLRPGQSAQVQLSSRAKPLPGKVHGVLTSASAADLTVPVRIDLRLDGTLAIGLFGTALIAVGERNDALTVPEAAVLRNDVTGKERVAVMTPEGNAHWTEVGTGVRTAGVVEILAPPLAPGTLVIVEGHVGLPEGAPVQVSP
jgi:RND family efflux transporter MFP subunit